MKTTFRKGIAMIELIFALVILGITLMSAPMLISQATTSSVVTFQQESIAISTAHTGALMTYAWDETNTINVFSSNILNVAAGDNQLGGGAAALTFPAARQRTFNAAVAVTHAIGDDTNESVSQHDDVDDFNGEPAELTVIVAGNNPDEGEYMDLDVVINTTITYADAAANVIDYAANPIVFNDPNADKTANFTNIKLINTFLDSPNTDVQITLNAFMCNIGSGAPRPKENL